MWEIPHPNPPLNRGGSRTELHWNGSVEMHQNRSQKWRWARGSRPMARIPWRRHRLSGDILRWRTEVPETRPPSERQRAVKSRGVLRGAAIGAPQGRCGGSARFWLWSFERLFQKPSLLTLLTSDPTHLSILGWATHIRLLNSNSNSTSKPWASAHTDQGRRKRASLGTLRFFAAGKSRLRRVGMDVFQQPWLWSQSAVA